MICLRFNLLDFLKRFFENLKDNCLASTTAAVVSLDKSKTKKAEKAQLRLEKKTFYDENRSKLNTNKTENKGNCQGNSDTENEANFNDLFE